MRWPGLLVGGMVGCLLVAPQTHVQAAEKPLALLSQQAHLVIQVPEPRRLVTAYLNHPLVQQFFRLEGAREFYESTSYRRFLQFLAYLEKQLGATWPELLDRLAGNGIAAGVQFGHEPPRLCVILQGKEADLPRTFLRLAMQVVQDELARQESNDKLVKGKYRDIETFHVGKNFHAAVAGKALVFGNSEKALQESLDLHLDGGRTSVATNPTLADAAKLLPERPLTWVWLNMDTVRKAPQAQDVFTLPRNDANLTILFGDLLDVAGRSPFVAAGLYRRDEDLTLTVALPRGREGMAEGLVTHVPPRDAPGCRPLLEPQHVLLSSTYYLDLSQFWEQRAKLFNEQQRKAFEEFDKNSGRFLAGSRFSQFVKQAGAYQRLVAVAQTKSAYKKVPKQAIPAFAFVIELREPAEFTKTVNTLLRGAALLLGFQVKLSLVEEKHGNYSLVGYRFPEDATLKGDEQDLRFNFSPCFVTVGNQFVASSTLELGHELVDLLAKEEQAAAQPPSSRVSQTAFYGAGGADFLQEIEDVLLTQAILDRATGPQAARKEVRALVDWVRQLGVLQLESVYKPDEFRYEVRLSPKQAVSK